MRIDNRVMFAHCTNYSLKQMLNHLFSNFVRMVLIFNFTPISALNKI